jgi:hypothetical protein
MSLSPIGLRTDADRAAIHNALHIAALNWVSGEEEDMRRAGLDRWAGDIGETFLRWQVPLDVAHQDVEAHLTLRTTDWDGKGHTSWRLVWQLRVFRTAQLATDIQQTVLAHLNEASMADTTIEDVVDTLYCVGTSDIVAWTKLTLAERGLRHAIQERS